jgi:lipopolysaccharide export system permease protein
MIIGTLPRYFGMKFLTTLVAVLSGVFALIVLLDYVEQMRRLSDVHVSALLIAKCSLFRVPQIAEGILPFCVLIGAMSCYLGLSRRLELVVSRAAGMSAWQFIAPAIVVALGVGVFSTTVYNPVAAILQEKSKRIEAEISGNKTEGLQQTVNGFWVTQRSDNGSSIINAQSSQEQGVQLSSVIAFVFDQDSHFLNRIEANSATLHTGHWQLEGVRIYAPATQVVEQEIYLLPTNLTAAQVRETFSTPETVPFWQLPFYIDAAERAGLAASGYRLQYQKLLARPFLLAAMVLLAAAFSLRFFRFGGVQKMVLGGITSGFLLFVMSKVTDDLSKAELIPPIVAGWLPVVIGAMTGFVALLYLEDG